MSDEYSRVKARVVTKDGLTETIIRKVDFENGKPVRSFLTRSGGWVRTGAGGNILLECYLPSEVYSPEPEKPVMDKIQAWQLFGKPFVFSHPEIFSWEDCGNSSTFEVKVDIRRVQ